MIAILVALLFVQDAGPPSETAAIRGRVVAADGRAMPGVQLRALLVPNITIAIATTDDDGRYELVVSVRRPVRVSASKTGYTTAEYGQSQPSASGEELVFKPGETRERVDFTLLRHSAIAGRVVDENADPVEGVVVSVQQVRFVNGHRQLAQVPRVVSRRTNERGSFRIWGLQPGEYFVTATVGQIGSDDLPDYAVTYFPGTPNPSEAMRVHVGASQEVANVDFPLARVKTATVRGTTLTSSGEPYQGGVRMRPSRRSGIVAGFVGAQTFPDGRFEFPNVAPGDYVIEAFKGNEFGWRGVTVNGDDVSDVEVQTLPGSTISGRVIFEGTRSQTAGRVGIEAMPSDVDYAPFAGGGASTQAQDDGTFLIERAIGARRLRVTPPRGWMLKRITIAGEDITDVALPFGTDKQSLKDVDVVLTDEVTEIAGVVSDAHDAPTAGALVVAFPEDADRRYDGSRYFAKTRSSRDGTYALRALPPARYCVAVVDRMVAEEDAWQDPEFLERLERDAARVTVTDGQRASLVLRVRP